MAGGDRRREGLTAAAIAEAAVLIDVTVAWSPAICDTTLPQTSVDATTRGRPPVSEEEPVATAPEQPTSARRTAPAARAVAGRRTGFMLRAPSDNRNEIRYQ